MLLMCNSIHTNNSAASATIITENIAKVSMATVTATPYALIRILINPLAG
jgi:hypothetical protein